MTVCASSAWAQFASETLTKTADFPFVRQKVQLQARASVLLPALVGEQRFKSNLADDCQRFEKSYDQYASHVDELSRELANQIRELSLGYTMKSRYELYLNVELLHAANVVEPSQWSLAPTPATLQFAEGSMMSISKEIGVEQKNAEMDAKGRSVLVLRSRDLACDLLSGRAQLMSTINLDVKADERAAAQARRVAQSWLDQMEALGQFGLNDRQKAAWLGFRFESFKTHLEAENLAEYLNIHYFFETFFQPNQILLRANWQSDISKNWIRNIQVTLPLGVEQL